MINIKKYDVGFGDFLSVKGFGKSSNDINFHLIIDCGSNIAHSSVGRHYINHDLSSNSDVLITHFHSDHYNILFDHSNLPFRHLFLRKPRFVDGIVEFIAIACLKIIYCVQDDELYDSSAWFIVNIIDNLKKLKCNKIITFDDGDIIISNDLYYIKAINVVRNTYMGELKKIFLEMGTYKLQFLSIVANLSQKYVDFCSSKRENINYSQEIRDIMFMRKALSQTEYLRKVIDELFDEIVNESSAVVGIWSKNNLLMALFLGDISLSSQKKMSNVYHPYLLKLSHHGTRQYNSVKVIDQFNPTYILMTYGYKRGKDDNKLLPELTGLSNTGQNRGKYIEVTIL